MKQLIKDLANWAAHNGAFVLTFLGMTGIMALAIFKDADSTQVGVLLGLYLGQTAGRAISAHLASSRDPNADTQSVIRDVEGTSPIDRDAPQQ